MAELSIRLFGQFRLYDVAGVPLSISARKARAVLALLALRLGQRQDRERLAALLWEDADDAAARSSLRQALTALRRALPASAAAALQADASGVLLDASLVEVDVNEFRKAPLERVLGLYQGHLLDGFDARSGSFYDLVAREREALRREALTALDKVQRDAVARGDDESAQTALLRLTELEPVNEAAQRALMELYARRGELGLALGQYRRCAEALERELGVKPEPQTETLQRELVRRRREAAPAAPVLPPTRAPAGTEQALRDAAALAVRIDLPADPERAAALMAESELDVAQAVRALGGASDRAVGSSVLGAFGLTEARGDEAERALRAALALSARGNAVGLAAGQVLSAGVEPTFAGPPFAAALALAARAGAGEVWATNDVYQSLAPHVVAERVAGAWRIKGLADPSDAPFVGRRAELGLLLSLLERCSASGKGGVLLLRGEAGMGKSRLLERFAGEAASRGASVCSAVALDFGQSVSERPLAELARLLGGAESPAESSLSADARQRARASALHELLAARAAKAPALVIVDDAHWTDADERVVLGHLAAAIARSRVLLVLSTRPEGDPVDATWRSLARGSALTTVDLSTLADDEARALADHYEALPSEAVDACLLRAEGNPLFLDQLLRAAAAGQASLPATVRSLVLAKLERLEPEARRLVQAAAILGHRFSRAAVGALLGVDEVDTSAAEEALLLGRDGVELCFGHALFRDAVYSTLLRGVQKDLHRRAADWFEPRDAALFAEHLSAAEDPRAGPAALSAARSLSTTSHLTHALKHAERAYALGTTGAARLYGELLLQAGRAHEALDVAGKEHDWFGVASALRLLDRHDEALEALARCEAELGDAASPAELARIWSLRGNLYFPLGDTERCLDAHERARAHAAAAGSIADEVRALGGLGDAHYQRGRMLTARDQFARAVETARSHDLSGLLLAHLPMLGASRVFCGEIAQARADVEEARRRAHESGELRAEIVAGVVRGAIDEYRADYASMLEVSQRSLELARQIGSRRFEAEAQSQCGVARVNLGDVDSGLALLRVSAALCEDPLVASYCGPTVLGALGFVSEPPERRALLERAAELLVRASVGANAFEFYRYAIAAGVADQDEATTARLCNELEGLTQAEPLPWSDLLISVARAAIGHPAQVKSLIDGAVRSDFRWLSLKLLKNAASNA
ncbi:MAG TPA: AAA family ATPase [Polyangiaceae bacterium]|nr:AAA family ATPase [Polyangiaceae bacterium]